MIPLLRVALPLLAAGCASDPEQLNAPNVATGVELAPFAIYEQCFALAAGDRVAYYFTARQPVAFNVHFREGSATIVPVDVKATREEMDDFTADQRQNYCLAWEAGPQGSVIDYRVQPVRPRR
jgi:hypothetical protein